MPRHGRPSWAGTVRGMELPEVQRLMEDLYGTADRERGIPATIAWLCEELGESHPVQVEIDRLRNRCRQDEYRG